VTTFAFAFRNDGELTIRAPALEFRESRNERLFDEGLVRLTKAVPTRIKMEDAAIYPGDEQSIANAQLCFECERETVLADGDYKLNWRVFLDNSPPSFGEIDLSPLLKDARTRARKSITPNDI
jgi:hypothetical protein